MNVHQWPTTFFSRAPSRRPIQGVVWHDTETAGAVACHAQGSWHWQIDRDGDVYCHVNEDSVAWGAAATDRWRPAWVEKSPINTSDINWCSIHVEVVSNAAYRAAGEPFTQAQYDAILELAADIEQRLGPKWHVGHGEVQADRSDPVQFDWQRAGFGDSDGVNGRSFVARQQVDQEEDVPLSPEDQRILDTVHGLNANADSIISWIQKLGAQDAVIADLSGKLEAELTTTTPKKVTTVTITYDDGSTVDLVPAQ